MLVRTSRTMMSEALSLSVDLRNRVELSDRTEIRARSTTAEKNAKRTEARSRKGALNGTVNVSRHFPVDFLEN